MRDEKIASEHLTSSKLVKPNTFPKPGFRYQVKNVWQKMWAGFLALPLMALILTLFAPSATGAGAVLLWLFVGLVVGILAWGSYWFGVRNFSPSYTVHGVTVVFKDLTYWVPPEVMKAFIGEIRDQWRSKGLLAFGMLNGVQLILTKERPVDPAGRIPADKVVGVTYPLIKRTSFVYAPYALSHGGAGYELRLQMCAFLFGYRDEREDIEWMTKHDLL